jgi:ATP-binding cassette subfamily C (CFTR/MRP) protein 1
LIASILSVIALITIGIDAGLVGLMLSYALNCTSDFVRLFFRVIPQADYKTSIQNWMVRSASEVEQYIVSAERIMHYMKIEPEAAYETEGPIDESWPSRGEVEFRSYSMRYRPEQDLVLKDISLVVVCLQSTPSKGAFQSCFSQKPTEKLGE